MREFHKWQSVEVRANPHMPTETNQWKNGTVEYAGEILSLVLFQDGSFDVIRNTDIRDAPEKNASSSSCP